MHRRPSLIDRNAVSNNFPKPFRPSTGSPSFNFALFPSHLDFPFILLADAASNTPPKSIDQHSSTFDCLAPILLPFPPRFLVIFFGSPVSLSLSFTVPNCVTTLAISVGILCSLSSSFVLERLPPSFIRRCPLQLVYQRESPASGIGHTWNFARIDSSDDSSGARFSAKSRKCVRSELEQNSEFTFVFPPVLRIARIVDKVERWTGTRWPDRRGRRTCPLRVSICRRGA